MLFSPLSFSLFFILSVLPLSSSPYFTQLALSRTILPVSPVLPKVSSC